MTETAARPCIIQIELVPGIAAQGLLPAIDGVARSLRPLLAADAVIEVASGFGARRSPAAILAVVSFALGVSQGVAGNAIWQLIQGVGSAEKSAVTINGSSVDFKDAAEALKRIEHILQKGSCVRITGE